MPFKPLIALVRRGRRYRRRVVGALMAVLALAIMFTASSAGKAQAATLLSQGQPATASSLKNATFPAFCRDPDRQHGYQVVECVLRPAVAPGRPRQLSKHQPGRASVGDRLRDRVPDPDLARRHELDLDLLHHHGHRRHPDPERHRDGPLRADVRDEARHSVRLQPVGVPGLRHGGRQRQFVQHALPTRALNHHRDRRPRRRMPPARRRRPIDGKQPGTRWSSAFSDPQWLQVDLGASQTICEVTLNWEAAYAKSFQIQTSPGRHRTWTTIYSTTHRRRMRHCDPERHRDRQVRPDVRHRAGHSLRLQPVGVRRLHHHRRHKRRWRRRWRQHGRAAGLVLGQYKRHPGRHPRD